MRSAGCSPGGVTWAEKPAARLAARNAALVVVPRGSTGASVRFSAKQWKVIVVVRLQALATLARAGSIT